MSNNNNFYNGLTVRPLTKLITMELMDLYNAYLYSRRHNRRSSDMVRFERNAYGRLYSLCEEINNREYRPVSNYAFIHYRNKAREVFAAEAEMKIIQAYVMLRLNPIVESELTDCTFNNRVGKGTHAAISKAMCDMNEEMMLNNDVWVIKWDLKGYFPNINQDIAYKKAIALLDKYNGTDKEDLAYLISIIVYCNPQFNSKKVSQLWEWDAIDKYKSLFSKKHGTGAAIGFLFWQIMSNYYLNDIDKYIIDNICPRYTRFVDDCICITDNKDKALQSLPKIRELYAKVDVTMHPCKFYCQQASKGVEFLGYHIHHDRLHLNRKIVTRAIMNAYNRWHNLQHTLCGLNSYAGMLKTSADRDALQCFFSSIRDKRVRVDTINKKIVLA